MFPMNKLDLAKAVATMVVSLKTAQICEQQVAQHTELNTDGIPVKVGCMVAGNYVGYKTKPYTDAAVEKAAEWLSEKFNKNEKQEYKSDR